jgi:hypothetical protein
MLCWTLVGGALAADGPVLWSETAIGASLFPSGAQISERVQPRVPLYRSDSIVFQDTYAGAGAGLAVTPAYVEVGPRFSLAPIDVFDVDVQGSWQQYFPGENAPLPYDALASKLESAQSARSDETVATHAFTLAVSPTFKLKFGPIVVADAWTVKFWHLTQPGDVTAPLVYEPSSSLILEWDDVAFEHQPVLLYTLLPGDDAAMFWLGATFRDRWAVASGDRSTVLGGLVLWRPAPPEKTAVPSIVVLVLPYLRDQDRVGGLPNVQMQVSWTLEPSL